MAQHETRTSRFTTAVIGDPSCKAGRLSDSRLEAGGEKVWLDPAKQHQQPTPVAYRVTHRHTTRPPIPTAV